MLYNNFELIIFNSLFAPEYVYKTLPKSHQIEILRRLYDGKVYHLFLDKNSSSQDYNQLIDVSNHVPDLLLDHFETEVNYKHSEQSKSSLLKKIKSLFF